MTQNNCNISDTLTTQQWESTKTAPLPVKNGDASCLPTVFDELRWSLQTAVRPLETGIEMVAGVHGITTNEPAQVQQIVQEVQQQFTNARSTASKTSVQAIALQSQAIFESINRINSITLEQSSTPLLRMYISDIASLHPAILQYIRDNDSTFTYFKPVSESIGLTFTIVADIMCSDLSQWAATNVFKTLSNGGPGCMRAPTFNKLFPEIGDTFEAANALTNGYIMRSMPVNSAAKVNPTAAHGFNNSIDQKYWQYAEQAKPAIYQMIASELKDQLRLLDQLVPVASNVVIENKAYNMPIGQFTTIVDQLGEKVFNKERSTDVLIPYDDQVIKETLR